MHECCNTTSGSTANERTGTTYRPAMDLLDTGDAYEVRMDLPGASRDGIDVTVEDGVLTIEAGIKERDVESAERVLSEFGVGGFRRRVRLGEDIDVDRLGANYDLGVLTITLPKRAEIGPRRIEINAG